jgi:NifU-like protein involved in Fe-S cluster formation
MVAPRLRDVLTAGLGAGELAGPGVGVGRADHPVCGDEVELSVRVDAGVVREVRWRASGCPASMAVAALAAQALAGTPIAMAAERLRAAIAAHGGLAASERHAEALGLRALAAALGA